MNDDTAAFRVISFQRGDLWVAVCLEHYMVTQAKTEKELETAIKTMFLTHILACADLGRVPFEASRPAPRKYWGMYEAAPKESSRRIEPPAQVFQRFPVLDIFGGSLAMA